MREGPLHGLLSTAVAYEPSCTLIYVWEVRREWVFFVLSEGGSDYFNGWLYLTFGFSFNNRDKLRGPLLALLLSRIFGSFPCSSERVQI